MTGQCLVSEIFLSIQGETSLAGWPCVLVRLAGCPLCCTWCDTPCAREEQGRMMSVEELVRHVRSFGVPRVAATGGEPLAQAAAPVLLSALCDDGLDVLLETSGALDISPVDRRVRIILDIKCPASGMTDRMRWENLDRLRATDEVKLVLADRQDYDFALGIIKEHRLAARCTVLLSPVIGLLEGSELAAWMLADRLQARLQLQLHKLIWPAGQRGV